MRWIYFCCLTFVWVSEPVFARVEFARLGLAQFELAQFENDDSGLAPITTYSPSFYQSAVSYNSQQLPQWQLDVSYDKERPFSPQWIDTINTYNAIDSITISASRKIMPRSNQRIFASLQTSNNKYLAVPQWQYLPSNAGTAASVGWQIGDIREINMVFGYEYRQLEDWEASSLLLDLQYFF